MESWVSCVRLEIGDHRGGIKREGEGGKRSKAEWAEATKAIVVGEVDHRQVASTAIWHPY